MSALIAAISGCLHPATGGGGGSPVLVQQASNDQGGNSKTRTATLPATATSGNTLLISFDDAGYSTNVPTGYTYLGFTAVGSGGRNIRWYSKTSDGTETGATVTTVSSGSIGVAVQEFQGSVSFSNRTAGTIASPANPQSFGPSDTPPSSTAVCSLFVFERNPGSADATWPSGWTGTSPSVSSAFNTSLVGVTDTAPNAATSASISYDDSQNNYNDWGAIWVDVA